MLGEYDIYAVYTPLSRQLRCPTTCIIKTAIYKVCTIKYNPHPFFSLLKYRLKCGIMFVTLNADECHSSVSSATHRRHAALGVAWGVDRGSGYGTQAHQRTYIDTPPITSASAQRNMYDINTFFLFLFLSLHLAFWRLTYYHIPTNALIISFIT
jgi:hypothetical protein